MLLKMEPGGEGKEEEKLRQDLARSELSDAFTSLAAAASNLKFELIGDWVLIVSARKDEMASSRLGLPDFVKEMKTRLGCTSKDCLVVVPFKDNQVIATKASSPFGCCILADLVDAKDALSEDSAAGYICSVPFRVKSMDLSLPVGKLLAQGGTPVCWERCGN